VAKSPTGVIPEELMKPGALNRVMQFLKALPVDGDSKVEYLIGWARAVGVTLNASQRAAVRNTGSDR
jgi:hypothetical protein